MKIIKSLSIFSILVVLFGSCFNPPEFSTTPHIEFNDIFFKVTPSAVDPDSLIVVISFKDGDGDLGLSPNDIQEPFQEGSYFLESNGVLKPVTTQERYNDLPPFINPSGVNGKLATVRTPNLPPFIPPNTCLNYKYGEVYISEENKSIFDQTYNLTQTLKSPNNPTAYVLLDTFYYEFNPNHYNIDVDFLIKAPTDPNADSEGFIVFDWRVASNCSSNFYGRFPVLSDKKRALEGTLRYGMKSSGFQPLLGSKTIKLQITIRDKALNTSNTIRTPEFTLNKITRAG
jgi:hypothetical protein